MNSKLVAPLYLIAFVACLITFFRSHTFGYLVAAVVWLGLAIYSYIRYNKNGNDLDD